MKLVLEEKDYNIIYDYALISRYNPCNKCGYEEKISCCGCLKHKAWVDKNYELLKNYENLSNTLPVEVESLTDTVVCFLNAYDTLKQSVYSYNGNLEKLYASEPDLFKLTTERYCDKSVEELFTFNAEDNK